MLRAARIVDAHLEDFEVVVELGVAQVAAASGLVVG
jgi:hypothetical protein